MKANKTKTDFINQLFNSLVCVIIEEGFKTPYLIIKQDDKTLAFANNVYEGAEYFLTEDELMAATIEYNEEENVYAVTLADETLIPFMLA